MELGRRYLAMVNFRFHLVSLTAVFFALALGVTVGATVLERTTVDTLESQVSRVEQRLDETDELNAALRTELDLRDRFSEQVGDRLVEGRLDGVPVVLIGVEGVESTSFDAFRGTVAASGAELDALVVFRQKMRLESEDDAAELAELLDTTANRPGLLRRQLFSALSTSWSTGTAHDLLAALNERGFVSYERQEAAGEPPEADGGVPEPERRFVIFSGPDAEIDNEELAVPLTEELARDGERLVLAAEAGESDPDNGFRAPFVATLRDEDSVAGVVSTVDNVGSFIGRTAAVLALADLGSGRLGHYGRGPGAENLVPPSPTN